MESESLEHEISLKDEIGRVNSLKKKSLIAGIVGLVLPPYVLLIDIFFIISTEYYLGYSLQYQITDSLSFVGFVAFGYFFVIGWLELAQYSISGTSGGSIGSNEELASFIIFRLFNPNWYLAPGDILESGGGLNDVLSALFLLDFYGNVENGKVVQSIEGYLMTITLVIFVVAIALSAADLHEASIVAYLIGMVLQALAFLNYYVYSTFYLLIIPFGVFAYMVAVILEGKIVLIKKAQESGGKPT